MLIRPAELPDAEAIALLHVRAWQAAYRGIMPDAYLNSLSVDDRLKMWSKELGGDGNGWSVSVALSDSGDIAGFIAVGSAVDELGIGEVHVLNVAPGQWRQGFGRSLLGRGQEQLANEYDTAVLWVVEKNVRARTFYESFGWYADGGKKPYDLMGEIVPDVRYRRRLSSGALA